MKRAIIFLLVLFGLSACAPNDSDRPESVNDYQRVTSKDSVNAGLTGTTNANGFIPADSNKSISNLAPSATTKDSLGGRPDSSKKK